MEIWKDVVGYEGYYQISNFGNVKSLSRIKLHKGYIPLLTKEKLMKININKYGYSYISLEKNKKQKYCLIHRLVGIAFIDNNKNKTDINHKNGVKHDNRLENLEWLTRKENTIHSAKTGLTKIGELNYCTKLKNKDVLKIRESSLSTKELSQIYNVSVSTIYNIKSRKKWKYI